MLKGKQQIFWWGWFADYPDAENFLFLFYGPNSKAKFEGENTANYDNPEYDRRYKQLALLDDGPAKQKADRRDGRHPAQGCAVGIRLLPVFGAAPTSNGWATRSTACSPTTARCTTRSTRRCARASRPSGTRRTTGRWGCWRWRVLRSSGVARRGFVARERKTALHADRDGDRRRQAPEPCSTTSFAAACTACWSCSGVNLLTFMLFFTVNTPDDMARLNIGGKRVTQEQILKWKVERGYDKPLYWNTAATGAHRRPTPSSGIARSRCSRSTSAARIRRAQPTSATRSRPAWW